MYMKNKGPKMVKRLLQKAKKEDFLNQIFRPGGSDGKASAYSVRDPGSVPGWGRSFGEGNGTPLQYSCLGNTMDGGAW